jgi:tetratricopeptide (TPR) repeat protein
LCLTPYLGTGQQKQTQLDSLLVVLKQTRQLNSEKTIVLRDKIGRLYKQRNLKQAMAFAEETLLLAKKVDSPSALATAYNLAGDLANLTGDFKKGAIYADSTSKALDDASDSLTIAMKYLLLMAKGGWMPLLSSDQEKIAYGNKSLALYTRLKNEEGMAVALTELGTAYKNKAMYHSKGIAADDSMGFKMARDYFKKAEHFYRNQNNKPQLAYAISIRAMMEKQLGFTATAIVLNRMAIRIYDREGCLLSAAFPLSEMADIYHTRGKFDSALFYIDKAIASCEQLGYKANLEDFYNRKAMIYETLHDYKNALINNKKARQTREEKYTLENARFVAEIENSYENKLKEEKILILKAEKELSEEQANEKTVLLSGIILFLVAAVIGLLTYLKQRQKMVSQLQINTRLDKALTRSLENQLLQAQLQALQGQMNPHFIYNALSSIQGLILSENKESAITYLNDFTQLSRLTLENSTKDRIKLSNELKFLHRYLDLESLRHQFKFSFKIEVDESLDPEMETIPPMLVQPVVENAIKHGLTPKKTKGYLHISFQVQKGTLGLICIVEDNGVGRRQAGMNSKSLSHQSLATEMNETRLKLFNAQQKLSGKYRMEIEDKYDSQGLACGTRVVIYLAPTEGESEKLEHDKSNYS